MIPAEQTLRLAMGAAVTLSEEHPELIPELELVLESIFRERDIEDKDVQVALARIKELPQRSVFDPQTGEWHCLN
jgi:hypothetical protein